MTTIIVNEDLCTRCGICSEVCIQGIVTKADADNLPTVPDDHAALCIQCGHCEAYCASDALLLNLRPDEKVPLPDGAGIVSSEDLGYYLKKRRSVRFFKREPVSKEKILEILDIARYAASGVNSQPVQWIVIMEPRQVRTIAVLTVDWMRTLVNTDHPMSSYASGIVKAWERGTDIICREAPHLLFAHIPDNNPMAPIGGIDGIIAMTHVDIAAPAFGIGTCWAGFVAMAAMSYEPLQKELGLPEGRRCAYAMMFGYPHYKAHGIPRRKPLEVIWR